MMRLTIVRRYLIFMSAPKHGERSGGGSGSGNGSGADAGVMQLHIV